jgi:predicted MFS family arabinose efflux permease
MHSRIPKTSCNAGTFRIAAGLFLAFLTVQAAFVVLALTLRAVAVDFDVGLGTAGQLRTAAAVAGVIASLVLVRSRGRFGTRALLVAGLVAMSVGAVASALAPGLALLLVAQGVVGAAGAITLAAGLARPSTGRHRQIAAACLRGRSSDSPQRGLSACRSWGRCPGSTGAGGGSSSRSGQPPRSRSSHARA